MAIETLNQAWTFTNTELMVPVAAQGVMLNVVGSPTLSEGVLRLGGVGETYMSQHLERSLKQLEHDDAGYNTRMALAHMRSETQPVNDAILVKELKKLQEAKDYSVDYAVDQAALRFVLRILSQRPVAVVGTKILHLLLDGHFEKSPQLEKFQKEVIPLTIMVTTSDEVASKRKLSAGQRKNTQLTLEQVVHTRAQRYMADKLKFEHAYPGLIYSPDIVRENAHVVFDNSIDRTDGEMDSAVYAMLAGIGDRFPVVAPYFSQLFEQ